MLNVQLVKVYFKLLMATHPAHPLILFLYHLTCVCLRYSISKEMMDIILDDEFVTSRNSGFCGFLIKWHGRLDSDAT